ncbi:MAG: helix-turn-helix domain-containing protein [Sedimentisphaerales bacterium]|nr:helix-turn-helix domain-containing protein [Sedimentisphaerales bacterium]
MGNEYILNDAILAENLHDDSELKYLYHQEKLILEVTEIIAKLMHKHKVNKSELAKRLGKQRSHVTQLLDGTSNMTLRTISDFFVALDSMLIPTAGPLGLDKGQAYDDSYYEFENEHHSVQSGVCPEQLVCEVFGNVQYIKDIAA